MRIPGTPRPVELAPGIWRIPLTPGSAVNCFALRDPDGSVTLVDAGLQITSSTVVAGLRTLGIRPAQVTRLVLTHAHADHIGGAARLLEQMPATASIHERDVGYARTGEMPRPDMSTRLGRLADRLPFGGFEPLADVSTFRHGVTLAVAGGLAVYHTPGHTPGHVSLLAVRHGVLLTGDALFNLRDISWPVRALCTDHDLNRRSADILGDLDYDVAAFTHGPEIRVNARETVRAFLRGRARGRTRGGSRTGSTGSRGGSHTDRPASGGSEPRHPGRTR